MQELANKRTIRTKTFDIGNGKLQTQVHVKPVHYVDDADTLQDVELVMEDKGTYWEMLKNNYTLRVAKDFSAPWLIQYKNQIKNWKINKRANITIKYEPHSLRWVNNPDLSDMQVFRTQQAVTGVLTTGPKPVIRYENAFGDGIHFEVSVFRTGFKKEIVIDAKNKLELPPTPDHKLVAFFKYDGHKGENARLKIKDHLDSTEWDENAYKISQNGFTVEEEVGLSSFIRPAYIFDSSEEAPKQPINVFWKKHSGFLWQAKVLPTNFLKNAVYPVRADTDTTSSPDADTETDTVDGGFGIGWLSTWALVRDRTTSNYTEDNGTYLSAIGQSYAPACRYNASLKYFTYRTYLSFKYNIASGQTIDAVTLAVRCGAYVDYKDNDAQAYVNVYENTNSSGSKTSLLSSDANIANIITGSPLATQIDLDAISTNATNTFTFNATGEGKITANGSDQFLHISILEGHDAENISITNVDSNQASFYSADSAYDPVLTITHSGGGGGPSIKSIAGVAQASIKSMAGVANASIKSVAGVANS